MNVLGRLHMLHRIWRYRLASEKDSLTYLMRQDLGGATVLDVGANRGIYTYWMSKKVGRRGRVIAFEPQPELGDFLLDLKASFHLDNVQIQRQGLSDKGGSLTMVRGKAGSGGARLEQPEDQHNLRLERIRIALTTLDNFFQKNPPRQLAFIKCDVEGHELSVFRGAEKTLSQHQPTLLFECHDQQAREGTLFSYLEGLGYTGFFIFNGKRIPHTQHDQYPYTKAASNHRNYIFTRRGQAADSRS